MLFCLFHVQYVWKNTILESYCLYRVGKGNFTVLLLAILFNQISYKAKFICMMKRMKLNWRSVAPPMSRYALSDDYLNTPLGIREKSVLQFATPLDIYSTLT